MQYGVLKKFNNQTAGALTVVCDLVYRYSLPLRVSQPPVKPKIQTLEHLLLFKLRGPYQFYEMKASSNRIIKANTAISADIIIRKATNNDAPSLALLARVTFIETFEHHFTDKQGLQEHLEQAYSVQKLRCSLQNTNTIFWMAMYKDVPVGYIKLKKSVPAPAGVSGATSQLQKIYVLKDFLSKGIGQQLLTVLFQELKTTTSRNIWLHVWEQNERAMRFYQKHGFTVVDQNYFTVGRDRFLFLTMNKKTPGNPMQGKSNMEKIKTAMLYP